MTELLSAASTQTFRTKKRRARLCGASFCIPFFREIIAETTPYQRTQRAALAGLEALRKGHAEGAFSSSQAEANWHSRLSAQADALPEDEEVFVAEMRAKADPAKILIDQYLNRHRAEVRPLLSRRASFRYNQAKSIVTGDRS
ncbi:MAG: methyltransferase MtaB domain-containing protein [Aggregatilineales bacterium]